ncbi:hypothetical protein [Neorhodopirellula pilleata]|uniref:Uncharacterized protein n=1 Tax=Neorhodopirellula pilleata TaxID=2714738 RepID=A0A5C5ZV89_9BACT|nr:hypothetical protein [Neorhodopirellula pilleata]TWT91413.1 hypothetical protein Pla100_52630 [Neorhodopirellula pilleata]TWT91462.1 hypothetical protein Pla100_53120 [Neorhodopirellula pilleata]
MAVNCLAPGSCCGCVIQTHELARKVSKKPIRIYSLYRHEWSETTRFRIGYLVTQYLTPADDPFGLLGLYSSNYQWDPWQTSATSSHLETGTLDDVVAVYDGSNVDTGFITIEFGFDYSRPVIETPGPHPTDPTLGLLTRSQPMKQSDRHVSLGSFRSVAVLDFDSVWYSSPDPTTVFIESGGTGLTAAELIEPRDWASVFSASPTIIDPDKFLVPTPGQDFSTVADAINAAAAGVDVTTRRSIDPINLNGPRSVILL